MKRKLFGIAAMAALVACSESNIDNTITDPNSQQVQTKNCEFSVSANDTDANTRVSITEGVDKWLVGWLQSDELSGWDVDCANANSSKFSIEEYDAQSSTFSGDIAVETSTLRLTYPYDVAQTRVDNKLDLSLATQNATGDMSNLSATTYMASDAFDVDDIISNPTMKHLSAGLELELGVQGVSGYTLKKVVIGQLPLTAELDLTKDVEAGAITTKTTGEMTVNVSGVSAELINTTQVYTVFINTFPFEVAPNQSLSVTAYFDDASSNEQVLTGVYKNETAQAVAFERATKNRVGVLLQTAQAATFEVTKNDADFTGVGFRGAIKGFSINSNIAWSISSTESWVEVTPQSSTSQELVNTPISVDIKENIYAEPRTATLTITPVQGDPIQITINQNKGQLTTEATELYTLYKGLNGVTAERPEGLSSVALANWGTTKPLNEWEGITTTTVDEVEVVLTMDISNRGFKGSVLNAIDQFVHMETLNMSGNELTGVFPNVIQYCKKIKDLDISDNQFSGVNLNLISLNLTALESFDVSNNQITGNLNNLNTFPTTIKAINVSANGYSGTFPQSIATLTNLTHLNVSDNDLTGAMPRNLAANTNLVELKVSGNLLSGVVHADFANNPNYFTWDAFTNIYPQQGDAATASTIPSGYKYKMTALGAMRVFYWASKGENWTWNTASGFETVTEPEWLYGFSAEGDFPMAEANYVGVSCNAGGNIVILGGKATGGTGNNLFGLEGGYIPLELAMDASAFTQIRLNNSGIGGSIPSAILSLMNNVFMDNCNIEMDFDTLVSNLRSIDKSSGSETKGIVELNLDNNKLTGSNGISDLFLTKWRGAAGSFSITGNNGLSGVISQTVIDELRSEGWSDDQIQANILNGTSLTKP